MDTSVSIVSSPNSSLGSILLVGSFSLFVLSNSSSVLSRGSSVFSTIAVPSALYSIGVSPLEST